MLQHVQEIGRILRHPQVYEFLHVPVQSGSDDVLLKMYREYTVADFRTVVDTVRARVPGVTVATDIIAGFPGETDEQWEETMSLVREYELPIVNISQFYARRGTAAAKMKRTPTQVVKRRSKALTVLHDSFDPWRRLVGRTALAWIGAEISKDGRASVANMKTRL